MDLKESKFDLEQAAGEVYEKAEQIYKGSEINQDTLTGVLHRFFKDTFTARQLQALEDYFEEQEKIFYDMYGGEGDLQENKKITEATDSTMDGKDVTNDFQMMKAFTSNFGPVKIIKNSYDKNYYIYRADETNTNNYLDFSKSKDYIEGWLSGAIKAKNNVISSKTESLQEAKSKQSLDDIARYLLDWDGYYEENFEEWDSEWDFVKDLTEDIQENFHLNNEDAQTVARKMYKMLQSKLEEDVHKQRIPTSELPDFCYSYNETTGEIIVIKKGVEGYYPSEIKLDDTLVGDKRKAEAEKIINEQNEILGVTDDQRLQMELNSMFGWDKTESRLNEVLEIDGEDVSIDSIFHFPNVIFAMQETCREVIMELNSEDKAPVTEKDIRVIYNELSKLEDIVNKYLEKVNPDENITESKKVTETIDEMEDFEKQDNYPEIDLSLYNTEAQEALIFIENHINTLSKEQIHELADKVFMEDIYTIKDFMKYLVTSDNDDIVEIAQEFKKYLPENKKVTEGYVIGLSTKTVKELAEDEVYDKYVQDINDGPVGTLNITTTDNIEDALQIEEKFNAYTLADEIKERYPEWNSVVAFFK